jgi:hypothetical protein
MSELTASVPPSADALTPYGFAESMKIGVVPDSPMRLA